MTLGDKAHRRITAWATDTIITQAATDNRWEGGGHLTAEGQWHFPADQAPPPPPTLKRADSKGKKKKNNKKGRKRCQVLRLWIKRAPPHCNANELLCLSEMAFCLYHLKCLEATLELPYESSLQAHCVKNAPTVWGTDCPVSGDVFSSKDDNKLWDLQFRLNSARLWKKKHHSLPASSNSHGGLLHKSASVEEKSLLVNSLLLCSP